MIMSANKILTAMDEAESLWPHNSHAVEDEAVEMAVLAAIGRPTDAPNHTALLRPGRKTTTPIRRLFHAVFGKAMGWSNYDLMAAPCDRCVRDVQPEHTLWVNAGATVVELHCCADCRAELDSSLIDLVWA